jgi:hypothetical protein
MKRKGKILCIRYGVNPNSSSIGTDLSYLLMGAATIAILVNVLDAGLRIWLRNKRGTGAEG